MSIGALFRNFLPQITSNTSFGSGSSNSGIPSFQARSSSGFPSFSNPLGIGGRSSSSSSMLMMILMMLLFQGASGGSRPRPRPMPPVIIDDKPVDHKVQPGQRDNLSAKELYNLDKKDSRVVIVDTRDKASYDKGHAKGAINIPKDQWDKFKPDSNKIYYAYCYSETCHLAQSFCDKFSKVAAVGHMDGGYPAWPAAKLPTEKS